MAAFCLMQTWSCWPERHIDIVFTCLACLFACLCQCFAIGQTGFSKSCSKPLGMPKQGLLACVEPVVSRCCTSQRTP